MHISERTRSRALLGATLAATLTTAYIHYTLGGLLLLLNALGYVGLAALLVMPLAPVQRLRPLVLLGLGGYTTATIVGWVVMGPYFPLAYITKGVEVVLLALIGLQLILGRAQVVPALRLTRALAWQVVAVAVRRQPAGRSAEGTVAESEHP